MNSILVATRIKVLSYFHSYDSEGRPSRLLDKQKFAYSCDWIKEGLVKLFGTDKMILEPNDHNYLNEKGIKKVDFYSSSPSAHYNYNGALFSNKYIKESILNFYKNGTTNTKD